LEDFLGTRIVERAGKTIQLTETGKTLAVLTQTFLRAVQDLSGGEKKSSLLRLGAGESILRWVVMPRLAEIQNMDVEVGFDFATQRTEQCVESLKRGHLDLAIVRSDAVDDTLSALPCGSMTYALVVPRKLLPGRTAAGLQLVRTLPFAMLSGDGVLAKAVTALAKSMNIQLDIRVRAENFSLILSAIENATLATVIPIPAVKGLSKETFAVIEAEGIPAITRSLAVVFLPDASNLRQSVRRVAPRLAGLLLTNK
jgi:DNA-binding transcriptional LysR family regulator